MLDEELLSIPPLYSYNLSQSNISMFFHLIIHPIKKISKLNNLRVDIVEEWIYLIDFSKSKTWYIQYYLDMDSN